ncbi:MAG: hypothetical protein N2Z62_10770 [Rhodobacteraceae bacterium]|nr:hypothetical protein [Paracoccaceae bacterium]
MRLDAALAQVLAAVPGALHAGIADLDQGLPLADAARDPVGPEQSEHLAALATAYLASAEAEALAAEAGGAGTAYDEAIALTPGRVAVFQRLPGRRGMALCVLAEGHGAPSAVAAAARGQLAALDTAERPA